jgi:hypothetical protein
MMDFNPEALNVRTVRQGKRNRAGKMVQSLLDDAWLNNLSAEDAIAQSALYQAHEATIKKT